MRFPDPWRGSPEVKHFLKCLQEREDTLAKVSSLESELGDLKGEHKALVEVHQGLTEEAERLRLQEVGESSRDNDFRTVRWESDWV